VRPPVRPPATSQPRPTPPRARPDVKAVFESVAATLEERAAAADETAQQILTATALIARDKGLQKAIGKHLAAGTGPHHRGHRGRRGVCRAVRSARRLLRRAGHRPQGRPQPGRRPAARPRRPRGSGLSRPERHRRPRPRPGRDRDARPEPWSAASSPRRAGAPATPRSSLPRWGSPRSCSSPGPRRSQRARSWPSTATRVRSPRTRARTTSASWSANASGAGRRWPAQHGPGRTRDGHPIALLANIGGVDDAEEAGQRRTSKGSGCSAPSSSSSAATGAHAGGADRDLHQGLRTVRDRRVVVRTLDAGADKPLAFADLGPEENPALGNADCGCRRCARTCWTPSSRPRRGGQGDGWPRSR
jgi:phosphotransferase system enzyme I (PtsI)